MDLYNDDFTLTKLGNELSNEFNSVVSEFLDTYSDDISLLELRTLLTDTLTAELMMRTLRFGIEQRKNKGE